MERGVANCSPPPKPGDPDETGLLTLNSVERAAVGSRHPEEMADWNRSLEVNNEASRPLLVALEGRLDLGAKQYPQAT